MDNNGYNNYSGGTNSTAMVNKLSSTMKKVYLKMTLSMILTAFVAYFAAGSLSYLTYISTHSWTMWALIIAEFGLLIWISAGINKMSSALATVVFYLFSAVNGLMLAPIFIIYTGESIAYTFFITAGTFGAMSIYGYTTRTDLTKFGSILIMALIGLIIASLVNIFMRSEGLQWIISIVGVLLFVGLTAWDTQQIKRMALMAPADSIGKLATIGALNLYLDFLNLFLYLLQIFGDNRN